MTILEALDEVMRKHFGTPDFGVAKSMPENSHFWAHIVLEADLKEDTGFGVSRDVVRLEELQRAAFQCIAAMDALSTGTRRYSPKSRTLEFISMRLQGHAEAAVFGDARAALMALSDWVSELRREDTFRHPAHGGRNWRAVSIARTCREIWGHGQWERQAHESLPLNALSDAAAHIGEAEYRRLAEAKAEFIRNCAPLAEKMDKPGPFGRFLEDVFEVLGVVGRNGERFSAHSALRSLSDAG